MSDMEMKIYRMMARQALLSDPLVLHCYMWERSAGQPWWKRCALLFSSKWLKATIDEYLPPVDL